jgi:glucose/arabinose dehydrogenase
VGSGLRRLCTAAAAMLLAPAVAAPGAAVAAEDTLLSAGKPATASSEAGAGHVAGRAVDADPATRWRSTRGGVQWISVDLGAMATIRRVHLRWDVRCARAYRVQTSPEGVWWRDVFTTDAGAAGAVDLAVTGFGRFVRVYATRPCRPHSGYALGDLQAWGDPGVVDTEPPTVPTGLRVTAVTPTSVALAWNPAADNVAVAGYDIFQQGQFLRSVDGQTVATNITRLTPTTTYGFYVNARDAAGNLSQASDTVGATTPPAVVDQQPPSTPANLRVTRATANSVSLAWDPATDDVGVTGYTVLGAEGQQPAVVMATATATTATVHGLAPATGYRFTVRAQDAARKVSPDAAAVGPTTRRGRDRVGRATPLARSTDVPWGIVFLPDRSALVTERDTHDVVRLAADGSRTVAGTVPDVAGTDGEGGLLGVEISPRFAVDRWVYLFHTTATDNRIVRMRYVGGALDLASHQVLLAGIARNKFHDGGRLRFGPDGKLYAATGDAQNGANAQNLNSLNGKVLRLNPDGTVPRDNPFPGKYVWSYGHRNVEGLAFDSHGRLWEAEFGNSILDEVNLVRKGANYGWPACEGTVGACDDPTFVAPVQTWPPAAASPSGLTVAHDVLYVAALRGTQLWRMRIRGTTTTEPQAFFTGRFGRLRTVEASPDGGLWLATSNGGDKNSTPNDSDNQFLHVALRR